MRQKGDGTCQHQLRAKRRSLERSEHFLRAEYHHSPLSINVLYIYIYIYACVCVCVCVCVLLLFFYSPICLARCSHLRVKVVTQHTSLAREKKNHTSFRHHTHHSLVCIYLLGGRYALLLLYHHASHAHRW